MFSSKSSRFSMSGDGFDSKSLHLFTLEDFRRGLDSEELVSRLTKGIIEAQRKQTAQESDAIAALKLDINGSYSLDSSPLSPMGDRIRASSSASNSILKQLHFDPVPFQQIFQKSIERLSSLQEEADFLISRLDQDMLVVQESHNDALGKFQSEVDTMFGNFKRLDSRISKVSSTVVQIGEKLEVVNQQRERCNRGIELINQFLKFNTGNEKELDPIFNSKKPSDVLKAAELIQTLYQITSELRILNTDKALKLISEKSGEIEKNLLDLFFVALAENNTEWMKKSATILLQFAGSHINSQYLFNAVSELNDTAVNLADVKSVSKFREALVSLTGIVVDICYREFFVIQKVFPNPDSLIKQLLERIFQDKMSNFLDVSLKRTDHSKDDYMRILEISFEECSKMIILLKEPLEELPKSLSSTISLVLDDQLDSLFQNYRSSYIKIEKELLEENCKKKLHSTLMFPINSLDEKNGVAVMKDHQNRIRKAKASASELMHWLETVLAPDKLDSLIILNQQILNRCEKLGEIGKMGKELQNLFEIFILHVEQYLQTIVDTGKELLPEIEGKNEPSPYFFQITSFLTDMFFKFENHFNDDLLPKLKPYASSMRFCINRLSETFSRIERRVFEGLSSYMEATCRYISRILSKEQKKTDYRPREDGILSDGTTSTAACSHVCKIVRNQASIAFQYLEGMNLDTYLTVFGSKMFDILKSHMKKYVVNSNGAIILMKDVMDYQEIFREFHIPALDEKFEILQHIASLFTVPLESIDLLLSEDSLLKKVDSEDINAFIKLRSDSRRSHASPFSYF